MSYKDFDEGHRLGLDGNIVEYAKGLYDKGMVLEAILVAHEYFEQNLNALYYRKVLPGRPRGAHRRFKDSLEALRSMALVEEEKYEKLAEFNRLRNIAANRMLDFSLELRGAKKGDLARAASLFSEIDTIIHKLNGDAKSARPRMAGKNKRK